MSLLKKCCKSCGRAKTVCAGDNGSAGEVWLGGVGAVGAKGGVLVGIGLTMGWIGTGVGGSVAFFAASSSALFTRAASSLAFFFAAASSISLVFLRSVRK